jgi:hypothetical protein
MFVSQVVISRGSWGSSVCSSEGLRFCLGSDFCSWRIVILVGRVVARRDSSGRPVARQMGCHNFPPVISWPRGCSSSKFLLDLRFSQRWVMEPYVSWFTAPRRYIPQDRTFISKRLCLDRIIGCCDSWYTPLPKQVSKFTQLRDSFSSHCWPLHCDANLHVLW